MDPSCSKRSMTLASRPLDFSRNASIPLENGSSREMTSSSFSWPAMAMAAGNCPLGTQTAESVASFQ